MDPLHVKDLGGVVHRALDSILVDCLERMDEGWSFTRATVTCVECLAHAGASFAFAEQVARIVSSKAYTRCREELKRTVVLRPGDTVDYTHDFNLKCVVEVSDDGHVSIKDP